MISLNFCVLDTSTKETLENKNKYKDCFSLLDLPDLPLECILEKLSPAGLTSMSGVCRSLRTMCTQDHLWEKHLKQKWGKLLIGDCVYKEWLVYIENKNMETLLNCSNAKGYFGFFTRWKKNVKVNNTSFGLPVDSIMSWYLSLESGNFSLPAQVYNRENGNVGFLLSCYDAKVSYNSHTNSFEARYLAHGRPTTEENIGWERLRSPAIDTSPYDLYVSENLSDLQPGDHFEIQWRKSKEFPYGWWYGVVGHLESCDGNKLYCQCHHSEGHIIESLGHLLVLTLGKTQNPRALVHHGHERPTEPTSHGAPGSTDTVVLEFKQYGPGSRWREVVIDRRDHLEVGNEADGFYAGIRKLYNDTEISFWKSLWPTQPLE
ncbi:F-box protein-like protein isoform X2 [Tanacetum coccineum]